MVSFLDLLLGLSAIDAPLQTNSSTISLSVLRAKNLLYISKYLKKGLDAAIKNVSFIFRTLSWDAVSTLFETLQSIFSFDGDSSLSHWIISIPKPLLSVIMQNESSASVPTILKRSNADMIISADATSPNITSFLKTICSGSIWNRWPNPLFTTIRCFFLCCAQTAGNFYCLHLGVARTAFFVGLYNFSYVSSTYIKQVLTMSKSDKPLYFKNILSYSNVSKL